MRSQAQTDTFLHDCPAYRLPKNQRPMHQRGFSLIELLIVVSLILIIASIAIPNLLRARIAANEAATAASIRTLNTLQVAYSSAYPELGFAPSLVNLGPPPDGCRSPNANYACFIDATFASAGATPRNGYIFLVTVSDSAPHLTYVIGAAAATFGKTGVRSFCSTDDGVIRSQLPSSQQIPATTTDACSAFAPL